MLFFALFAFKQEKLVFSIKVKTKSTTPVAISALNASPESSIAPIAILPVIVRTLWKMLFGISGLPPITIITAIVSPRARPIDNTIPAKIPLFAAGKTTLKVACSFVAPSARAFS